MQINSQIFCAILLEIYNCRKIVSWHCFAKPAVTTNYKVYRRHIGMSASLAASGIGQYSRLSGTCWTKILSHKIIMHHLLITLRSILHHVGTVCPRILDPYNMAIYYVNWAKTSYILYKVDLVKGKVTEIYLLIHGRPPTSRTRI